MTRPSGKRLSTEELDRLRLEAVALRLQKKTLRQITAETGLTAPTVQAAYKCFLSGGWAAVRTGPRGRPAGGRSGPPASEAQLLTSLAAVDPEQVNPSARLWSTELLRDWLARDRQVTVSARTALRYAERWGLVPAARELDSSATREGRSLAQWKRHAADAGLVLLQGGLAEFAAEPGAQALAQGRLRPAFAYARDNRGAMRWLHQPQAADTGLLLRFFERLLAWHPCGVLLLFKSADLGRLAEIDAWLDSVGERFKLVRVNPLAVRQPPRGKPAATRPEVASGPSSPSLSRNSMSLTHLQRLEAESMQIMREVVAETDNPVMLYSIGKDSAVMLHLARKAFHPSVPPFPLLHVDTTWKFQDMYRFRDKMVQECGMELLTYTNPEGLDKGINPFTHGSAIHTDVMKTEALKQALNKWGFDAAFGGARRDEEKSRAKERVFSFRSAEHRWDPKNQRPELWKHYNSRKHKGESIRVFPLSNWTELDIWQYIHLENVPIVPLYYSAERPVVERDGVLIMVDDERMPLHPGEVPMLKKVRFRTLGCYPLTGAVESEADTLPAIIQEMLLTKTSERQGRVIDHDSAASMEKKKQEGYF